MRVEREGAEEDVAGCLVQRCGLHTSPGVERGGGGCSGGGGRAACYRTWPPLPSVQCAACHCPTRFGLCLFIVYFSLSLSFCFHRPLLVHLSRPLLPAADKAHNSRMFNVRHLLEI